MITNASSKIKEATIALRTIIFDILAVLLMVALVVLIWQESRRSVVVLEPIALTKTLEDFGYTPVVLAQRLQDELRRIVLQVRFKSKQRVAPAWRDKDQDVVIPGTGTTLGAIASIVRHIVGKDVIHVSGDITHCCTSGDKCYSLVLRISEGGRDEELNVKADDEQLLVREGGKALLKLIEPNMLAWYLYDLSAKGDADPATEEANEEFLEVIRYCLNRSAYCDSAEGLQAWASFEAKKGQFASADGLFALAVQAPPEKASYAYSDWGISLARQAVDEVEARRGRADVLSDKAEAMYRHAIALNANAAAAHSNLGHLLMKKDRFEEAIEEYRRTIAVEPSFAWAHKDLGDALRRREESRAEECRDFTETTQHYHEAVVSFRQGCMNSDSWSGNVGAPRTR